LRPGGRRGGILGAALGLALAAAGFADDTVSFSGYFKNFSILLVPPEITAGGATFDEPDMGSVSNRLRLKLTVQPSKKIAFNCEYDLSPRIQDARLFGQSLFLPDIALGGYRLVDFRNPLSPGPGRTPESFALYHNLDRFVFTLKTGPADILIGRQAIAWGSARVVNPTDVLAPFAFNELDKEERTGVDAVRVRIALGKLDELDLGVVAGDKLKARTSAFYIRGKVHVLKTDVSAITMAFRDNFLFGLDLARSVGGAGTWIEAAFVAPQAFRETAVREKSYVRVSAGADYNFSSRVYGFAEYHFSSAGARRPERYLTSLGATPYVDGAVYLLGRHYISLGTTYQISPLLPFTGLVIANLGDLSVVLAPSVDYNISQNIYLSGGAYVGVGRRPELVGLPPGPSVQPNLLHSEFGSYPKVVYASFRVYF